MSLTRNDVTNIAHLARLAVTDEQLPVYVQSLSSILDFVEQLSQVQTGDALPMAHPLGEQVQRLRADEVTAVDEREKLQRNALAIEASLYLVPKVIE